MADFAVVLLVDRRGWLLLQERDEHAPLDPNRWGLVGGYVDEGEDFATAAPRELKEETGLSLDAPLTRWADFPAPARGPDAVDGTMVVFTAGVDVDDEDIVVGEGRQIVFCDPQRISELDLTDLAAQAVASFVRSELYASLAP